MFTTDQMVWIVQEAARVKSPIKLNRDNSKLKFVQFSRVIELTILVIP